MSSITIDDALDALRGELESIDEQIAALTVRRGHVERAAEALGELDVLTSPKPVRPPAVERPAARPRPARNGAAPAAGKVTRDQVLDVMRSATEPIGAAEVARRLDTDDTKTVSNRMVWLVKSGHLTKLGAGQFLLASKAPPPLRAVPDKPETVPGPGAVPLGGPIGRTPFDPDQARRAAGDSV